MNVKKIIAEYQPHKGFWDLSNKPDSLDEVEYAKILETQSYLARENEKMRDKAVRMANKSHWEHLKELSAKLQSIISQYWNVFELN